MIYPKLVRGKGISLKLVMIYESSTVQAINIHAALPHIARRRGEHGKLV
jgi:hypothetical protein